MEKMRILITVEILHNLKRPKFGFHESILHRLYTLSETLLKRGAECYTIDHMKNWKILTIPCKEEIK